MTDPDDEYENLLTCCLFIPCVLVLNCFLYFNILRHLHNVFYQ